MMRLDGDNRLLARDPVNPKGVSCSLYLTGLRPSPALNVSVKCLDTGLHLTLCLSVERRRAISLSSYAFQARPTGDARVHRPFSPLAFFIGAAFIGRDSPDAASCRNENGSCGPRLHPVQVLSQRSGKRHREGISRI
jgi:hypothetical protein